MSGDVDMLMMVREFVRIVWWLIGEVLDWVWDVWIGSDLLFVLSCE